MPNALPSMMAASCVLLADAALVPPAFAYRTPARTALPSKRPPHTPASPIEPHVRSPPSLTRTSLASAIALAPPGSIWLDALRDWVLSYADPRPYTLASWECRLFLLTNSGYFVAGALVGGIGGGLPFGMALEMAGAISIWYHYEQCGRGGTGDRAVQTAMAFDYGVAVPTLACGLFYAIDGLELAPDHVPYRALSLMTLAFAALAAGWIWDKPRQYFALHGLWHVLGAIAAAELASWHAQLA